MIRDDLPYARLLVQGDLQQAECIVVVNGQEVARLPMNSHSIWSESGELPTLSVETYCYDHTAAGGLPAQVEEDA